MAGQPITRKRMAMLDTMEEELLEMTAAGANVKDLIELTGVGSTAWYKWLKDEPGRREAFDDARALYAEVLDKEGLEIADEVSADREQIQRAKLRIEQRRHIAGVKDRSRHQGNDVNVNVNLNQLHLEALEQVNREAEEITEADYELLEEGED